MTNYSLSLKTRARAILELRRRQRRGGKNAPEYWGDRFPEVYPAHFTREFSDPHTEMHEWAAGIEPGRGVRPFVALWSRGRGKSTNAEAIAVDLGARGKRVYCMYISGTQDQADKHVYTIANMMESKKVEEFYPDVSRPKVGKHGSRSWRRNILRAYNGYTVEAVGLNKAVRGQKIDWARPDLMIFDDIDERHDTEKTVKKKIAIITDSILPAGAPHVAIMVVQNLIHDESIATRLSVPPGVEGGAEWLARRIISGPFPAAENFEYERGVDDETGEFRWRLKEGVRSVWAGFSLADVEAELNLVGPPSFKAEYQHDIDAENPDALMTQEDFNLTRVWEHPELELIGVGVDPPGGATECGIICGGRSKDKQGYILEDNSQPAGVKPKRWAEAVLDTYYRNEADLIWAEQNYGGDMVEQNIRNAKLLDPVNVDRHGNPVVLVDGRNVKVVMVHATRGKRVRAEPMATAYQSGRIHNVGKFDKYEREWTQWVPGDPSPNRLDAGVWVGVGLKLVNPGPDPEQLQRLGKLENFKSRWE